MRGDEWVGQGNGTDWWYIALSLFLDLLEAEESCSLIMKTGLGEIGIHCDGGDITLGGECLPADQNYVWRLLDRSSRDGPQELLLRALEAFQSGAQDSCFILKQKRGLALLRGIRGAGQCITAILFEFDEAEEM
jgi:hypothetical protein